VIGLARGLGADDLSRRDLRASDAHVGLVGVLGRKFEIAPVQIEHLADRGDGDVGAGRRERLVDPLGFGRPALVRKVVLIEW